MFQYYKKIRTRLNNYSSKESSYLNELNLQEEHTASGTIFSWFILFRFKPQGRRGKAGMRGTRGDRGAKVGMETRPAFVKMWFNVPSNFSLCFALRVKKET